MSFGYLDLLLIAHILDILSKLQIKIFLVETNVLMHKLLLMYSNLVFMSPIYWGIVAIAPQNPFILHSESWLNCWFCASFKWCFCLSRTLWASIVINPFDVFIRDEMLDFVFHLVYFFGIFGLSFVNYLL
jgi:hypothetical protein